MNQPISKKESATLMASSKAQNSNIPSSEEFIWRHIGPNLSEIQQMVDFLGFDSLDDLIESVVPKKIWTKQELKLGQGLSEREVLLCQISK